MAAENDRYIQSTILTGYFCDGGHLEARDVKTLDLDIKNIEGRINDCLTDRVNKKEQSETYYLKTLIN